MGSEAGILVITHTAGEDTPAHHLVRALGRRRADVALLELPFYHSRLSHGDLSYWRAGKELWRQPWAPHPGGILGQMLKDPLRIRTAVKALGRVRTVVALDNLNAAVAIALRGLGLVDQVVYYVIDHTPQRFANPLLNWIYGRMDVFCCLHADRVWVLGNRMREAKLARGAKREQLVEVPIGVSVPWKKAPAAARAPRLVVVSHLEKSKGVQLAIESLSAIRKQVRGAELHIYGSGPYEGELKALAGRLGLGQAVVFHGFVKEHAELLAALPQYQAGLAPYLPDAENYSHWADPAKPKEYLAAGLPVVITRVPLIAEEIEARPMGLAIDYTQEALVGACVRLLKDARFRGRCRRQGLHFAAGLDWGGIFDRALAASDIPVTES